MQRDMWVGLAWAGGLVLAMVSVFFYGLITYEPVAFDVTWTDNEHAKTVNAETLAAGDDRDHEFTVPGLNVTAVHVLLEWSDPVGSNDEFELTVTGPGDIDTAESGSSGTIEIHLPVAERPAVERVEGANAQHALEQLERPDDPWASDAALTVTVTLVAAPGTAGTQGLMLDPEADGENDYTLTVVRVTTDATLTPRP